MMTPPTDPARVREIVERLRGLHAEIVDLDDGESPLMAHFREAADLLSALLVSRAAVVAEMEEATKGLNEDREHWRRRFEEELARAEEAERVIEDRRLHAISLLKTADYWRERAGAVEQERARLATQIDVLRKIIEAAGLDVDAALSRSEEPQNQHGEKQ